MTPPNVAVVHQRFTLKMETARLSVTLESYRNTHYTAAQPKRSRLKSSPPWKPRISHRISECYSLSWGEGQGFEPI